VAGECRENEAIATAGFNAVHLYPDSIDVFRSSPPGNTDRKWIVRARRDPVNAGSLPWHLELTLLCWHR
jgi:hypothetical protein